MDRQQLDLLLANPGATNLRWLVLACEELRVHGVCVCIVCFIVSYFNRNFKF
jgi:hypothetical protein